MPDENLEQEQQQKELLKMKAEAFDLRAVLDRLTAQGSQLADVYNKMCAAITEKEKTMEKKENVNNDKLPE